MNASPEILLEVAELAAREAGKKIKPLFGKGLVVREKEISPSDIYSEADLEADEMIYSILTRELPDFNYLSEDRDYADRGSEYTWVVDPLDGLIPFVAGLEYWGISIGLLKDEKPVLGVVNIPMEEWLFSASEGQGAFLNGQRINVSSQEDYEKAIIGFDVGHKKGRREDLLSAIAPQIEEVRYMPSFACCTFGQVLVAKGTCDAYLHHRAFPWDFCAGAIIVQEAGGRVTDHQKKPIDWRKRDNIYLLASNGLIHEKVLKAISSRP